MAENTSDATTVEQGLPRTCTLCHFPAWSTEQRSANEDDLYLKESFEEVSASASAGCNGCKLFVHVWEHIIPEADGRDESSLFFNRSGGDMFVNIYEVGRAHDIEVFTLPGRCPSFLHFAVVALEEG